MNIKPGWAYKYPERWDRIEFNKNYLKDLEELLGELHCEYCGKNKLIIYEWDDTIDKSNVATVDHFYPKSRYKDLEKDVDNFVVSCYGCNNKKKDDLWLVEEIEFPKDKEQLEKLKNKWKVTILNG